jgi:methylenetetrahydrofolate dehydrogenase (NADP+)/methenyltetrahydrofolate cyclohydrolase
MNPDERRVLGGPILGEVLASYKPYRAAIAAAGKRVTIIRFEAEPGSPPDWVARMEASRISAEQKVKNFTRLGFTVDDVVLPGHVSRARLRNVIRQANNNPAVSGIIVQFPPPPLVRRAVQEIAPAKDYDALLDQNSPYPACATAEGISRLVEPFAQNHPKIAVVGSNGFVGRGVVRLLEANGHQLIKLDLGDDLSRVREADIVISVTGTPGVLGPEHLRPEHQLVVDSGFVPQPDGSVRGDVQPEAYPIPQHITPVPGGTGPTEMAILMERAVRKEVAPDLTPWRYLGPADRSARSAGGPAGAAFTIRTSDVVRDAKAGKPEGPVQPRSDPPQPGRNQPPRGDAR